jgi:hypothetical protein
VALVAALAVLASMVLPWIVLGQASESYFDLMQGKDSLIRIGWLPEVLLAFGPLVAALAAGSSLLRPSQGPRPAQLAAAGFVAALVGFGLWFVLWGQINQELGWLGVQMGVGEFAGIIAAIVGLVASIADVRSPARPMGQLSSDAPAQMPAVPFPAPLALGWQSAPLNQTVAAPASWSAAGAPSATGASGRISYVEGGRPGSRVANAGDQILIGRDPGAQIHLSDPKVSRKHAMIELSGGTWIVRNLGATNPTQLLSSSGASQPITNEIRIPSGQLLFGEVLVTLFPIGS